MAVFSGEVTIRVKFNKIQIPVGFGMTSNKESLRKLSPIELLVSTLFPSKSVGGWIFPSEQKINTKKINKISLFEILL